MRSRTANHISLTVDTLPAADPAQETFLKSFV